MQRTLSFLHIEDDSSARCEAEGARSELAEFQESMYLRKAERSLYSDDHRQRRANPVSRPDHKVS